MPVAEAIQVILVPMGYVTTAIAGHLLQQLWMLASHAIAFCHLASEQCRVERGGALRARKRRQRVYRKKIGDWARAGRDPMPDCQASGSKAGKDRQFFE